MKSLFFGIAVFCSILCTSCFENYFFEQKFEIQNETWTHGDTLVYSFQISDTLSDYNIYLDVDHSVDYHYQNMYVFIHTAFPSGKRIKDRVSIEFANNIGKWHGNCSSEYCALRVVLQEKARFLQEGNYTITLEQYMRTPSLSGIKSLTLRLEKTGSPGNSNAEK